MKRFREKRVEDAKPVLLRLGVALAVPLASYVASNLRTHTNSFDSAAGDEQQGTGQDKSGAAGAIDGSRTLKDELYILRNGEVLANVMRGTSATPTIGKELGTKIVAGSRSNKILGNVEALLSLMRILQEPCSIGHTKCMSSIHVEGVQPLQEAGEYPLKKKDNDVLVRSPGRNISGIGDGLLLPQVISKASVQELNGSVPSVINCSDGESSEIEESLPESNSPLLQEPEIVKPVDTITARSQSKDVDRVTYLSSMAKALLERERMMENQMLEYCGRQKQETAVRELESRLEMSSMQSKLLGLQIESLQDENQRLKLLASKNMRTMQELDSEKVKVQNLKSKLKSIRVHAREKLASLEQRLGMLLDQEQKRRHDDAEAQSKLKRLQELEGEAAELKSKNFHLERENMELAHKLERAQESISTSSLLGTQTKVIEEVKQLREANGKLAEEIEQLQTDRFADVEELVYLRWLNACLRYETKNHTRPPGKTIARDLSSRLSPKSGEKAKQLILDYADDRAVDECNLDFLQDPDSQYNFYSLQGLSDEYDDDRLDIPCMNKEMDSRKKTKFFGKLKKLVTRKSSKAPSSGDSNSDRRESVSTRSVGDVPRRSSSASISSCYSEPQADDKSLNRGAPSMQTSCRSLLDTTRMQAGEGKVARCRSDLGVCSDLRRMPREDDGAIGRGCRGWLNHQISTPEKARVNKLAEALASARAAPEQVIAASKSILDF